MNRDFIFGHADGDKRLDALALEFFWVERGRNMSPSPTLMWNSV